MASQKSPGSNEVSRRSFLGSSGAVLAASALSPSAAVAARAHVLGREQIKVGLVGCGGRGGGAAVNALRADPACQLVAMGDAFEDRVRGKLSSLKRVDDIKERVLVDADHVFWGFDAYKKVIDSCDVVCLAATPHFRPIHLRYAIEQGKHVFCEKPVATDAPGVRSVMATCELARKKGLSIVSGLCWRYADTVRQTMDLVHEGAIGDLRSMEVTYHTNGLWHRGDKPEWSRMEYQIRNWLYFHWLSGDMITEQHIHSLDKAMWAMKDQPPARAFGVGGRQVRTDKKYGNIYDHFAIIYEWEDGRRVYSSCRQWDGCKADVSDHIFGTKGICHIASYSGRIEGETKFKTKRPQGNMYQLEHDALFRAIRAGEPINNGDYMAKSTLMAILGRQAAYTGQSIGWEQMLNSEESLAPEKYDWVDVAAPALPMPGHTRFR
ncbi:MAG: oxidoreductase [Planctomycetota bacterium]|nr:MAG: oxidoreductase [Planctomycetota bacterium]